MDGNRHVDGGEQGRMDIGGQESELREIEGNMYVEGGQQRKRDLGGQEGNEGNGRKQKDIKGGIIEKEGGYVNMEVRKENRRKWYAEGGRV